MKAAAQSTPTEVRAELERIVEEKDQELTRLKNALAWLSSVAPSIEAEKPERKATKKPGRKPKAERTPRKSKKASAAARPKTTTRRGAEDDDAPRARKGHVPKVGVEQSYCATLQERREKTGELKAEGYRRIGPGEPLTAGTYDVRPSGDEDDSCVVLWRAKAEVDGE